MTIFKKLRKRQGGKNFRHSRPTQSACVDPEAWVAASVAQTETSVLHELFSQQGSFLHLETFLPPSISTQLAAVAGQLNGHIHRSYVPGRKQGGSVSRFAIDDCAPLIPQLYHSRTLMRWLEGVCGDTLRPCPEEDPHAYALYYYTRAGDHIGWHYDTSYYEGRRYTLLIGVMDDSSCRLEYELHTRDPYRRTARGSIQNPPGGIVFFDGDKLRHRVTALAANQTRVSLTFEYVTDQRMSSWRRFLSNMKDCISYFGFREVFRH